MIDIAVISAATAFIGIDIAIISLEWPLLLNCLTGKCEPVFFRVSQKAWLSPMEYKIFKRIDRRLKLATNFETAENLTSFFQIPKFGNRNQSSSKLIKLPFSCYFITHSCGIGGYFKPHIDCVNITEPEIEDRTIFTSNSKISLLCTKNAAFFWYNLMRTGEIDMRSRYVAFPVLTGIKWAVTKWLRGQKLRRPRGLSRFDQERYMGDLGAPGPKRSPQYSLISKKNMHHD
ncbi:BMA-PHY-2, isoform b [Dirofilaria immitis]|nr:BMA-PHY-2, isoform b [Dirofilaria immitis]